MSRKSEKDGLKAIIAVKVDSSQGEDIARRMSELEPVKTVYMVTGEADLMLRAQFNSNEQMKMFIVDRLAAMKGVRETKTMMVVSTFKEDGEMW